MSPIFDKRLPIKAWGELRRIRAKWQGRPIGRSRQRSICVCECCGGRACPVVGVGLPGLIMAGGGLLGCGKAKTWLRLRSGCTAKDRPEAVPANDSKSGLGLRQQLPSPSHEPSEKERGKCEA